VWPRNVYLAFFSLSMSTSKAFKLLRCLKAIKEAVLQKDETSYRSWVTEAVQITRDLVSFAQPVQAEELGLVKDNGLCLL
jgi:hypothetical protein